MIYFIAIGTLGVSSLNIKYARSIIYKEISQYRQFVLVSKRRNQRQNQRNYVEFIFQNIPE